MGFDLASLSLSFLGYSVFWREKGKRGSEGFHIILYNFASASFFWIVGIYIEL